MTAECRQKQHGDHGSDTEKSKGGKGTTKGETPGEASRTRRPRRVAEGSCGERRDGQAGKAAENGRTERKGGRAGGGTQCGEGSPRPRRWRQSHLTHDNGGGERGSFSGAWSDSGAGGADAEGGCERGVPHPVCSAAPPPILNLPSTITCPPRLPAGTEWKERERLRAGTALLDCGECAIHPGYGQIFFCKGPAALHSPLAGGHDVKAGNCVSLSGSVQYIHVYWNEFTALYWRDRRTTERSRQPIPYALLLR